MARLTDSQWADVKARYALGQTSLSELAREFGVSHTAIQKKIKEQGWVKLDANIVQDAIESRAKLKLEVAKVANDAKVATTLIDAEVDRLATIKNMIQDNTVYLASQLREVDIQRASDLAALAVANKAMQETHFGKSPETAIQINNNAPPPTVIQIVAAPTK
jgi:predicted DNA-binding protein YlxM (UPF0122 family)